MSGLDEILNHANKLPEDQAKQSSSAVPSRQVVVITCMDTRINPYHILNINEGDVHLLRNAGGIVTEDTIRSLVISQRKLGTCEVLLIQHTDCGMMKFEDHKLKEEVELSTNSKVDFDFGSFKDLEQNVKDSVNRLREHPLLEIDDVRGYVYDVHTAQLHQIA